MFVVRSLGGVTLDKGPRLTGPVHVLACCEESSATGAIDRVAVTSFPLASYLQGGERNPRAMARAQGPVVHNVDVKGKDT